MTKAQQGEIVRLADADAVIVEAARRFVTLANNAVANNGRFSVALSGGSTPQRLYSLLASEEWRGQVPWADCYFFFGDERRVPHTHEDSNFRMVREALFDHVNVPPENIFAMDGIGLASGAIRDYDNSLRRYFGHGQREWPRFDLVLLGLGEDTHTASIFPGTRAVSDLSNRVLVYYVPQLQVERITLTLPVFNHAAHIIFIVIGEKKAEALQLVLKGAYKPSTYPAQAIQPVDGSLTWLVDKAAAATL